MKLLVLVFALIGIVGCEPTKPLVQFHGIDLSLSPSVLEGIKYTCKDGKEQAKSCIKYDENSSFLGEPVKSVEVEFKGNEIQYITLTLNNRSAAISDLVELESKLGSAYAVRESKMNMKLGTIFMSHWNAGDGAVVRLFISSGVKGILSDTVKVIYYPNHMVRGDL